AQQFNVTVSDLKAWNNLSSDLIFEGKTITVSGKMQNRHRQWKRHRVKKSKSRRRKMKQTASHSRRNRRQPSSSLGKQRQKNVQQPRERSRRKNSRQKLKNSPLLQTAVIKTGEHWHNVNPVETQAL